MSNASFAVHTPYLTPPPCAACAIHILARRTIKRVVYIDIQDPEFVARWAGSLAQSRALLNEGGVEIEAVAI